MKHIEIHISLVIIYKDYKVVWPYKSIFGQHIFECMISNMVEFLLAPFFEFYVCLTLMKSIQVSKFVKSKVLSTLLFTNLLIYLGDMSQSLMP